MRGFFFAPESPRPLALMRIAVGLVFLYDAAVRWRFAVELYSVDGFPMPVFPAALFPGALFEPPSLSAGWAVALHSLLLFALAAVVVGWRTRWSLWVALLCSLWLGLLDQSGTFKKYSVIGVHLLLLLSLTRCGGAWSIDALLDNDRRRLVRLSPAWPRRLIQVLLASVYLGAATTKIRLADFANGDLLTFSLLDDLWGGSALGLWLSTRPTLLIWASMGTISFEVAFPLLVWNSRLRRPMLCLAALFHLAMAASMSLGIFSPVMLAALLAFVEERDLRLCATSRQRAAPAQQELRPPKGVRLPTVGRAAAVSAATWLLAAATLTGAGVLVQQKADWYGVSGSEQPVSFERIDSGTATDMLASLTPAQKSRYDDYFHRVELGNRLSIDGTRALGGGRRFDRGATVYACARLIQNHPPLQIEWTLVRPDRQEMRYAYELAATVSHATVGFALTDPQQTPPGEYRLILRADGYKVATRGFVLEERR